MSKIISPVPIQINITYNEMTGEVRFALSKDLPFPTLVLIFSQLMSNMVNDALKAHSGPPNPGPNPAPNPFTGGGNGTQ